MTQYPQAEPALMYDAVNVFAAGKEITIIK